MKKALKIILGVLITIYLILVVLVTGFLLNRNDYGVSKFLGKYLVFVEESLEPTYQKHSLIMIEPVKFDKVEVGDKIFFYDTYSLERKIKFTEVTKKEVINESSVTYTLKDNNVIDSQNVLGTEKDTTVLTGLGQILYIVQSKWGFLFLIVFPLFLAFIYEIYSIYKEVKNNKEEKPNKEEKSKK